MGPTIPGNISGCHILVIALHSSDCSFLMYSNLSNSNPSPTKQIHSPALRVDSDSKSQESLWHFKALTHREITSPKFYHSPRCSSLPYGLRLGAIFFLKCFDLWTCHPRIPCLSWRSTNGEDVFLITFQFYNQKFKISLVKLNGVFGWNLVARIPDPYLQEFFWVQPRGLLEAYYSFHQFPSPYFLLLDYCLLHP